jgi:hypothetical protein
MEGMIMASEPIHIGDATPTPPERQNASSSGPWPERWEHLLTASALFLLVLVAVAQTSGVDTLSRHVFWILAPIPGLIGILYYVLNLSPRFNDRATTVSRYAKFLEEFDREWIGMPRPFNPLGEEIRDASGLGRYTPSFAATLWGAVLLTIIFFIPSSLAQSSIGLSPQSTADEATKALAFAALGCFIFTLQRLIGRVNSGVLNSKFLLTSALRAAVAMLVGYAIGASGLVTAIPWEGSHSALYFLAGLFNSWAMEDLRQRAMKVFKPSNEPTEHLPLGMIDGIQDDEINSLAELGVTEVQHLATSDPGVLTIRSLFPFNRVLDWIDQAILITYLRSDIVKARHLGIRGALDYVVVIQNLVAAEYHNQQQAAFTLMTLSEDTALNFDALQILGFNLFWDYKVNLISRLWQRDQGQTPTDVSVTEPPQVSIRDVIRDAGYPSSDLLMLLYNERLAGELRREAAVDASRFREQNPDTPEPDGAWLTSSYQAALATAQARAAVGTQPKPGANCEDAYKTAILTRLGKKGVNGSVH